MKRRDFIQRALVTVAGASLPSRIFAAADAAQSASAASATAIAPTPLELATKRLYELGKRDVAVHDPSTIVKCKDEFWVFYTGNRSYRSKDLLNWTNGPGVLTAPFAWFDDAVPGFRGTGYWAPDCMKIGDRYFVYYAISAFGKNTSAIGLVTSPTLDPADPDYAWTDHGMVIKSVATDDFNCIDPAIVLDFDGNLWLSFGSFWTGIKLIALDKKTGLRIPNTPLYSIAQNEAHATATTEGALTDPINKSQIEASYIYPHDKYYYLFVDWGLCCHGLSSTYNIRIGRSEKITGPYLDKDGKDLAHDGGTLFLGDEGPIIGTAQYANAGRGGRRGAPPPAQVHAFIGPGHAGIIPDGDKFWFSCHYYDGTTPTGASILDIRPLTWDKTGWPVLGEYPDPAPKPTARPQTPGRGGRGGNRGRGGNNPVPATTAPATTAAAPASTTPAGSGATN